MSLSASLFGNSNALFQIGNVLGLGIPGYIDRKMNPPIPTQIIELGELSSQTAKESEPRAVIWGRYRPIGGNIIHCQAPVRRFVTTTQKVDGKGGKKKKQKTKTEHVYRSYAIGVCEGPITRYVRIWRNGKLVYEYGTDWGSRNNATWLQIATLYLGAWTQNVDPTLQAIWGIGNVPAYRGTAYMVVRDEDLTNMGGAVPQYQFEVERGEGTYLTSKPYPIQDISASETIAISVKESPIDFFVEAIESSDPSLLSGELRTLLLDYSDYPAEATESSNPSLLSGQLKNILLNYSDYPAEATESSNPSLLSGQLRTGLSTYNYYPAEATESSNPSLIGASHGTS